MRLGAFLHARVDRAAAFGSTTPDWSRSISFGETPSTSSILLRRRRQVIHEGNDILVHVVQSCR